VLKFNLNKKKTFSERWESFSRGLDLFWYRHGDYIGVLVILGFIFAGFGFLFYKAATAPRVECVHVAVVNGTEISCRKKTSSEFSGINLSFCEDGFEYSGVQNVQSKCRETPK
jgi:hypothetical protein